MTAHPQRRQPACLRLPRQTGFSYIEVILAVLLMTVCLVPALDALRNAIGSPLMAQGSAQGLVCVRNLMEQVVAEPYRNLLLAAGGNTVPAAAYSLVADAACPARNVTIAMYDPTRAPAFVASDSGLLYITVAAQNTSVTPATTFFSLTTLVAR